VSNFLKRKAQENPCDRPSKFLHNELKNYIETLTHNDCTLIKKNMHYARRSIQPSIPKSLSDIHKTLNDFKIKTNREKAFLSIHDSVNNIIIFSKTENLNFLC